MFLYLTSDWLSINKSWWRFLIKNPTSSDESEQQIPISLVEWIVIFGRIQISTDAIKECLKWKIPVFFLSKWWYFFGKLDSLEIKNVELLYNHIKASLDQNISSKYAKNILVAKIHNSKTMLQRWNRFYSGWEIDNEDIYKKLDELQSKILSASSLEEIRGYEWVSARLYFEWFAKFIKKPFVFEWRNRRPPKDPVNSMLSLGYTLLAQTIQMILNIQWIETQIGFLHQPKDLKTLLVLDIMEMYRAWIVDDMVIRLINKWKIKLDHFLVDESNEKRPVNLLDDGLKIFIEEYYKIIFKEKGSNEIPFENDFIKLKIIEKDFEIFKQSLVKETHDYEGFKIK